MPDRITRYPLRDDQRKSRPTLIPGANALSEIVPDTFLLLHLQQERAFGSKRFQAMAEKTLGRPVSVRRPGRPSRDENEGRGI